MIYCEEEALCDREKIFEFLSSYSLLRHREVHRLSLGYSDAVNGEHNFDVYRINISEFGSCVGHD